MQARRVLMACCSLRFRSWGLGPEGVAWRRSWVRHKAIDFATGEEATGEGAWMVEVQGLRHSRAMLGEARVRRRGERRAGQGTALGVDLVAVGGIEFVP